jgi:hypothetical protein
LSDFHAANPISIDYPLWANDSCVPIFPNGTSIQGNPTAGQLGCSIGNYPVYAVNATTSHIISHTIQFAAKKNIRLNIKNTGHSFPGRSTGYGSLSIWTHNIHGFEFHDEWKPDGCSAANSTSKQMAATIGAGMQDREVYSLAAANGAIIVGGSNPSVGIHGWFPGGGHGPLSSSYGMGADNVLQIKIVTPDGNLVTANECQNSDLFWALRGGGAGTFGVTLEVVMKAYPTPQTSLASIQVALIGNGTNLTSQWWRLVAEIHTLLPDIKDAGGQGYYLMPQDGGSLVFVGGFYHYGNVSKSTLDTIYQPLRDLLDQHHTLATYQYQVTSSPTFFDLWNSTTGSSVETVGGGGYMVSRLLTRRALTEGVDVLAKAFTKIGPAAPGDPPQFGNPILLGHMIANDNNRGLDVALNPAWRDTVTHFIVVNGWTDDLPRNEIQDIIEDARNNKVYALKELCPECGAYFNEV